MCRTGGRRCPSSVPQSKKALNAKNAKRRLEYATKKIEALEAEHQEVRVAFGVSHARAVSDKLQEARRIRNEAAAELVKHDLETVSEEATQEPRQRKMPSARKLGFPDSGFVYDEGSDFDQEEKMWKELKGKLNSGHLTSLSHYTEDWAILVNYRIRQGNLHRDETEEEAASRRQWYKNRKGDNDLPDMRTGDWQANCRRITTDMDKIIERHSGAAKPRAMWRGAQNVDQLAELKVGSVIDFPSFTSVSRDASSAGRFSAPFPATGGPYVVMELLTKKGLDVGIAEDHYESESILPRNTRWRVAGHYSGQRKVNGRILPFDVVQLVDEDYLDELEQNEAKTKGTAEKAAKSSKTNNTKKTRKIKATKENADV